MKRESALQTRIEKTLSLSATISTFHSGTPTLSKNTGMTYSRMYYYAKVPFTRDVTARRQWRDNMWVTLILMEAFICQRRQRSALWMATVTLMTPIIIGFFTH